MQRNFGLALLAGVSALAVGSAHAQTRNQAAAPGAVEEVVVTGSRTITNGNNSPTPVTVVTMEELAASKPTTIYEALLEMPMVAGARGRVSGSTGQGGNNNSISALNFRALGSTRALALYDGHRVPPQNQDGQVDLNQIPQMLLQRVDVQAGGASAVYGSDAIVGVTNFITNRNFNGIKAELQYGASHRNDDRTYEAGIAAGRPIFDRGHIQGSLSYNSADGLLRTERDYIQEVGKNNVSLQGNGCPQGVTPCVPFFITSDVRDASGTFGGRINQIGTGNPFNGMDFAANGVLSPFRAGTPVGTGTNQIGGNGGYTTEIIHLAAKVDFAQIYGRFDYDLTDNLHFYLSSFYVKEHQFNFLANVRANGSSASSGLATGFRMTVDNAFLPTAVAQQMRAAGVTAFNLGKYFAASEIDPASTNYTNQNLYLNTGLEGKLGKFKWDLSYTASKVEQANRANQSWDGAKLYAALDSVLVNGTPTCWVLTQPQFAAAFQGCVPMNIFGPSTVTPAMLAYVQKPTHFVGTTELQDLAGGISGDLFDLWAGPLTVALSGEMRKLTYGLTSEAEPANVNPLNCNALGLLPTRTSCVMPSATNVGTTTIFPNGTAGRTPVNQKVSEVAIEGNLPLLVDQPFAQELNVNFAARYAHYKSTGSPVATIPFSSRTFEAVTWKAGLDYHLNDMIAVRATRSRDFRAPNLSDLYLPGRTQGLANGTDLLTGAQIGITPGFTLTQQIGGNPNLKPEVGYTTTFGVVLKPTPSLTFAVDYYDIVIKDAITTVNGQTAAIQNSCYDSGGTSPYCSLQVRPGGFARNPANQALSNNATLFFTAAPLNVAEVTTHGIDFEANYRTDLFGRAFSTRVMATWQPEIATVAPGTTLGDAAGVSVPKVRVQFRMSYNLTEALKVDWSTRWRSELANTDPALGLQSAPGAVKVDSVAYSNVNVSYKLNEKTDTFINVQNVFNTKPPAYPGGIGFYPGDDAVGTAFHVGVRMNF